jgi:hypothetical protein
MNSKLTNNANNATNNDYSGPNRQHLGSSSYAMATSIVAPLVIPTVCRYLTSTFASTHDDNEDGNGNGDDNITDSGMTTKTATAMMANGFGLPQSISIMPVNLSKER